MTEHSSDKPARILVALDAARRSSRVLDLAVALAMRRNAELVALFVEDVNLFHLAELPFAMEVDSVSGVERKMDSLAMSQTIQGRVARVREILNRLSQSSRVRVSLTVVRGHYVREAISAASGIDVLFLDHERFRVYGPLKRRGACRESGRAMPELPVWVLYDGSGTSVRALRVASELTSVQDRELVVAMQMGEGDNPAHWREEVVKLLKDIPFKSCYVANTLAGIADFVERVKHTGASVVVADRQHGEMADLMVKTLLEGVECPVVLVA